MGAEIFYRGDLKPMSRRKTLALFGGGLALAVYTMASISIDYWASAPEVECDQPCKDLGREVLVPGDTRGAPTYRPVCQPLKLGLELSRKTARRNSRYSTWYRASLANQSCYRLEGIEASSLIYSLDEFRQVSFGEDGFSIRAKGPDGTPVPQGGFSPSKAYHYLYHADRKGLEGFRARFRNSIADLSPGEELPSVSSEAFPVIEEIIVDVESARAKTILRPISLPKGAESPPEGFRILDSHIFHQAGGHRLQAVFRGEIYAAPPPMRRGRIPKWVLLPASQLRKFGLIPSRHSEGQESRRYRVEILSPEVEVVVE